MLWWESYWKKFERLTVGELVLAYPFSVNHVRHYMNYIIWI